MRKLFAVAVLLVAGSTWALADQITFSVILGSSHSVDISKNGLELGPAANVSVSDQQTGAVFPLDGVFASSTGASTAFTVFSSPPLVLASFDSGKANSVLIVDGSMVLVAGTMENRSSVAGTYGGGTGAFQGEFVVTEVNPAVLALFGFGPGFQSSGSVSATFGQTELVGSDHFIAELGGADVTIQTPAPPVAEAGGLGILGTILIAGVSAYRRRDQIRRMRWGAKSQTWGRWRTT